MPRTRSQIESEFPSVKGTLVTGHLKGMPVYLPMFLDMISEGLHSSTDESGGYCIEITPTMREEFGIPERFQEAVIWTDDDGRPNFRLRSSDTEDRKILVNALTNIINHSHQRFSYVMKCVEIAKDALTSVGESVPKDPLMRE